MQPTISVIIPVYNKEKYLPRCLDSIIGQTMFNQLEVIIIDDGSIDNSFVIMQEYQIKYSNINIFKQINAGVSTARNKGIILAKGKYLHFLDADDFMDNSMLEILHNKAEQENSEVTICGLSIYNNKNKSISKVIGLLKSDKVFVKQESIQLLTDTHIAWSVCNKLYKLKFLRDSKLFFDEEKSSAEDFLFNLNALLKSNKTVFIDKYLYYYVRMIEDSLTRKPNPKLIEEGFSTLEQYKNLSCEFHEKYYEEKKIIEVLVILGILSNYFDCIMNGIIVDKALCCKIDNMVKVYCGDTKFLLSKKISTRVKMKILLHRWRVYSFAYKIYYFFKKFKWSY